MIFLLMIFWFGLAVSLTIVVGRSSGKKTTKTLAFVALGAFAYSSYWLGHNDGEGSYFSSLRAEMNPFLRELGSGFDGKKKEALKDFMLRAEDIKLQPADYLADLKGARKLLKKEPISERSAAP